MEQQPTLPEKSQENKWQVGGKWNSPEGLPRTTQPSHIYEAALWRGRPLAHLGQYSQNADWQWLARFQAKTFPITCSPQNFSLQMSVAEPRAFCMQSMCFATELRPWKASHRHIISIVSIMRMASLRLKLSCEC